MARKRRKTVQKRVPPRRREPKRTLRKKVLKYRRPINLNLGIIIFATIFIYILVCIFLYFTKSHITAYEVKTGSLAWNNTFRGIALRKEEVVTANKAGYINYYARETEKVSGRSMVYTIDESGKLNDMVYDNVNPEEVLTPEDLNYVRIKMEDFSNELDGQNFESVYQFKREMEGTVLKLGTSRILSNINSLSRNGITDLVNFSYAPKSGVLVYNVDGYEGATIDTLLPAAFDESSYKPRMMYSNDLVGAGDPVFKLVTDENWSIVIPIDEEWAKRLGEEKYVEVRFLKNGTSSWAGVSIYQKEDRLFCKLDFTNSMIAFAADRFIDIELVMEGKQGLKIPNSSIVETEFYLIPKEYLIKGGNSDQEGFMREAFTEKGELTTEFIPVTIYDSTEKEYYVDESLFQIGEYIIKPDSAEKYPISKKGSLTGVYNINKGYADFKKITVLYQNEEYSVVKSNTEYGLNVYDHIVLDGAAVSEGESVL